MGSAVRRYGLFIDGKEMDSVSGKTFMRENPATEEPFAEIAEAQREDVDRAVKAAKLAFEKWSHVPPRERSKFIYRLAELLEKHKDQIALTNTDS
jgi:acyl-CoA reductase-like NAD-dependent aldehyde dehydrogenase